MLAAKILNKLVEAEEYSDLEVITLLNGIYNPDWDVKDDINVDRLLDDIVRLSGIGRFLAYFIAKNGGEDDGRSLQYVKGLYDKDYKLALKACRDLLADATR